MNWPHHYLRVHTCSGAEARLSVGRSCPPRPLRAVTQIVYLLPGSRALWREGRMGSGSADLSSWDQGCGPSCCWWADGLPLRLSYVLRAKCSSTGRSPVCLSSTVRGLPVAAVASSEACLLSCLNRRQGGPWLQSPAPHE